MTTDGYTMAFADATGEIGWGVTITTADSTPIEEIALHLRRLMLAAYDDAAKHDEHPRSADAEELPGGRAYVSTLEAYRYADGTTNTARFTRHLAAWRAGEQVARCMIRIGAVARRHECMGRDAFITEVTAAVRQQSIMLLAPRRFGKTSILCRLHDHPPTSFAPVLVDVESCEAVPEFLAAIAVRCGQQEELAARLRAWPPFRQAEDRVPVAAHPSERDRALRGALVSAFSEDVDAWEVLGQELFAVLQGTPRLLLLIDELTEFLRAVHDDDAAMLQQFLRWFHTQRVTHGVRVVIASSQGTQQLLDALTLDGIDDLRKMVVPPLQPDDAAVLLEELLYAGGVTPSPDIVQRALALLGEPVPYFVQVFAQEIIRAGETSVMPLTPSDIITIYEEHLLGVECRAYFRVFTLRLHTYPAHIKSGAKAVLDELSRQDTVPAALLFEYFRRQGRVTKQDFETVMAYLEEDYYIEQTADAYRFRSQVLRDFWRRQGE